MRSRFPLVAVTGCLILVFCTACAGPMSPFGAINSWTREAWNDESEKDIPWDGVTTRIVFTPGHQVLHGPVPFSILIEDPAGIPENFQLKLFYNGMNAGPAFLVRAERLYTDSTHRRLRLSVKNLRILASRENKIRAVYRRTRDSAPITATYQPPRCSAFDESRSLASIPEFDAAPETISLINRHAKAAKLNPYYVAGLIAQESGFDPLALSRGRALGLTQVTAQGEAEVVKKFSAWPRYPGLDEMPLFSLKQQIQSGKVNGDNEWRLNPALSIQGGVEYLSYLSEYWKRPDKKAQVEAFVGTDDYALSLVMLASYNSGGSRVSAALEAKGKQWLQEEELGEARKYVRRVSSYCDYFTGREE